MADRANDRVQVFDGSGGFLRTFGSFGTGNGEFDDPFGLALDDSGNIFVGDRLNNRVQVFDNSGTFQFSIENPDLGPVNGLFIDDTRLYMVSGSEQVHVYSLTSIPEPSSFAFMAIASVGFGLRRRRKR